MLNKMTSIGQFRQAVKSIQHQARFTGFDENGDPIYDNLLKMPVLKANGTVKIHGTNAGVSFHKGKLYAQKKKSIITPNNDNAGFASYMESKRDFFLSVMNEIITTFNIDPNENIITILGEWAGKGIQKNVAVNEIEKSFFAVGVKIKPLNEEIASYWLDDFGGLKQSPDHKFFVINQFKMFSLDIDFNEPLLSQNKMLEMVLEVEKECPVGKHFGISGTGEGIVFTCQFNDNRYIWKVKGDKHAGKSKVKKLKKVDDEKLQKIIDIVDQVTPEWRLVQIYDEVFDVVNGGVGDVKGTGDYLRALIKDVWKEENDLIEDAGLTNKDVNAKISAVGRKYFMNRLNEEVGL